MGTYIETERLKLRDWEEKDLLAGSPWVGWHLQEQQVVFSQL